MTPPFRVGLTGGIGAGKSTVAVMFADLGAKVVDTDVIARELTAAGGIAIPDIRARFGEAVLAGDGGLDRAAMRARVFADASARRDLEAILHPLIRARAARASEAGEPYVILVVPLLIEHLEAYRELIDRVAVVDCEPETRLTRISGRPGLDPVTARAMLDAQIDPAVRLRHADDVIDNRGDPEALRGSVHDLHRRYLALASEKKRN